MDWRERISVDPDICYGKACIRGTRVMVWVILDSLGAGESPEVIARDHRIELEDVRAALMYAGELAREWIVVLPVSGVHDSSAPFEGEMR
jgi:uncharacterized protein (DUF433 family)